MMIKRVKYRTAPDDGWALFGDQFGQQQINPVPARGLGDRNGRNKYVTDVFMMYFMIYPGGEFRKVSSLQTASEWACFSTETHNGACE